MDVAPKIFKLLTYDRKLKCWCFIDKTDAKETFTSTWGLGNIHEVLRYDPTIEYSFWKNQDILFPTFKNESQATAWANSRFSTRRKLGFNETMYYNTEDKPSANDELYYLI